jgi:hypothetical protein
MQSDLESLKITAGELEHITGLDISETFMGRVYRPTVFRKPRQLLSLAVTELLTFGLILVFCLPFSLILARSFGNSNLATATIVSFLQIAFVVSVVLFLLWNACMTLQGKKLKILAHLLDEVDKHNEIIDAVDVIDQLGAVKNSAVALIDRPAVIEALTVTRESIVCALMTEKILRKHQRLIARRYELFSQIETNLATLQAVQMSQQATEYAQLLNEALAIGRSVHQELEPYLKLPK